ncbi:tail fiber assembly protein [Xenorhabdus stockiae]|uniref:Tail fiber assembly protein n=1 Tax=Xenorhabdus stockiae TaxID=351614 RepID=A0A2D0KLE4_9GAMM|nr:tail fiber assembly protein [Xenorhabdus stockiae]PHM64216.1 tail fiber assembly protein [Xenorhabdus stockiae]
MRYFKDNAGSVYAYNEIQTPKEGLISITEKEAKILANPPLTTAQLITQAEYEKRTRLAEATRMTAPLQYAVDLQMATQVEQISLTAWKKYCVLLNRVDCATAPDIIWPEQPE